MNFIKHYNELAENWCSHLLIISNSSNLGILRGSFYKLLYTVVWIVKWYNCYEKQYGGFLKNETWNHHISASKEEPGRLLSMVSQESDMT